MTTYAIAVSDFKLDGKLLPGDPRWSAFNRSFHNLQLDASDLLDVVYTGRAITTHHRNNWRATENYLCGQHIGLDFDTEDTRSTLAHLDNDKFVARYAAFVHTTISHTPDHPRARVIFLLDQPIIQPKNYALAASALLWLFGTADRQCKDVCRFFYGAPGCDVEYINRVLPLDVIKRLIDSYIASGQREKRRTERPNYLPPATQQEVADALQTINPWHIEYDEWVSILMAIHHQFGDAGYSLAESWADGRAGEVEQKWRSFKASGNGIGTVTIATLFAIAKRSGWERTTRGG
jgi:hypothetical protein